MAEPRVVIVGAGPGGLAAALQAAQAGAKVTVLEKQPRVGGRTSTLSQGGFRFDLGPTFFHYPRILCEVFKSIGRDLWHEIPMHKIDPMYRVTFGTGGSIDATQDIEAMERQVERLAPQDVGGLSRYMRDNRIKLDRFRPIPESPFNRTLDLLNSRYVPALPWLRPWRSLAAELGNYFSDPRLLIAFSFQSKYLGMSPYRCPSLFSILSFLEYEYGVFHPVGGCGAVTRRMAEIATEMGVDIRLGEPVTSFEFQGRKPSAAVTASGRYACDSVVISADFAHAMGQLVPNSLRRRWRDTTIERKRFSCSTFMMYLGIRGLYEDLPHHNIHISADYQRNLRQIENDFSLPDDPSFYVQNACVTDRTLAPTGMSTLYVLVPVLQHNPRVDWTSASMREFRSLAVRQLRHIGIDDLEERIVFEKILTPANWENDHSIYRGATFNLAHSLNQMLHYRPNNRFEDLEQVYLVGGGTHPGSGLPVIFESSRITCKQMLPALGLDSRFIEDARAPFDRPISASEHPYRPIAPDRILGPADALSVS